MRFDNTDKMVFKNKVVRPFWFNDLDLTIDAQLFEVTSKYAGNPPQIADFFYNDSSYFWAIIMANNPANYLNWPKNGDTIIIPNIAIVKEL